MFHNSTYFKDCRNIVRKPRQVLVKQSGNFVSKSEPSQRKKIVKHPQTFDQNGSTISIVRLPIDNIIITVCKILYYYFVCSHRVRSVHRPRGVMR